MSEQRSGFGQRGSFTLGLIVGLLIGLALALGVALYITKVPVPFVNKVPYRGADQDAAEAQRNKAWDPNAPLAGKNPARPASAAASGVVGEASRQATGAASAAAPAPATANQGAVGSTAAASSPRHARDPAAILSGQGAASAAKSTAKAVEALVYFVQAGAYARAEDADQQRAKLAILGLDARVTEREQSGRTVYRVRLGPFDRREDAEASQARLSDAKIEANLVRVER